MQIDNVKEIQTHLLAFLKRLVTLLDENGINYHFAFGTVLGAIRHKGFIPWDDDVDLCIVGADYERFLKIVESDDRFTLITKTKYSDYPMYFAKIVNNDFLFLEPTTKLKSSYPKGLHIDVFKLEFVSDNLKQKPFSLQMWEGINFIKNTRPNTLSKFLINLIAFWIPQKFVNRKVYLGIQKVSQTRQTKHLIDIFNDDSRRLYEYEWIRETVFWDFEDTKIRIPKVYDPYLRSIYGDYMQIPTEKKRKNHTAIFKTKDAR